MKKILLALLLISTNLFAQEIKSFVSADGTEIFYEDIGEGETIVLLSGGPGLNSSYLKDLYSELQKNIDVLFCIKEEQENRYLKM